MITNLHRRKIQRYGWKPDLPDPRDHMYSAPRECLAEMPPKIDLEPKCPPVYNQEQTSSCTGNSTAFAVEFDLLRQGIGDFRPSRLFPYYNARVIEGTQDEDSGAMIRDVIKSIGQAGVCHEDVWPFDPVKVTVQPPQSSYSDALHYRALNFSRILSNLSQTRACLASGYPFVFGFSVYSGFESDEVARTGILELPTPDEDVIGGHAVACIGYDDATKRFKVRNSWGADWGQGGYFTMPYSYMTDPNLADDFWTIRVVSG